MQILCVSCGAVDGKGKDSASALQQPQRQAPATSSGGLAEQAADWGEEEGDEEGGEEQDGEGDREGESAPPSSAAEKRSGQRAADSSVEGVLATLFKVSCRPRACPCRLLGC